MYVAWNFSFMYMIKHAGVSVVGKIRSQVESVFNLD